MTGYDANDPLAVLYEEIFRATVEYYKTMERRRRADHAAYRVIETQGIYWFLVEPHQALTQQHDTDHTPEDAA